MPGREYKDSSAGDSSYRYGFNGKRKDGAIAEDDYDFGERIYDPRLGRFLSVDPCFKEYISSSNYIHEVDNPIRFVDVYGEGPGDRVKKANSFSGTKYSQKPDLNQGLELRTGNTQAALDYLDCSELVCRVLADDGITSGVKAYDTKALSGFLSNTEKFIHSNDKPQAGDVFLWIYYDDEGVKHGHTGIVTGVDGETVYTMEAYDTKEGTGPHNYQISKWINHKGWQGFYRPKTESAGTTESKPDYTNFLNLVMPWQAKKPAITNNIPSTTRRMPNSRPRSHSENLEPTPSQKKERIFIAPGTYDAGSKASKPADNSLGK